MTLGEQIAAAELDVMEKHRAFRLAEGELLLAKSERHALHELYRVQCQRNEPRELEGVSS